MTTLKRRSSQLLLNPDWDDISIVNYHDGMVIVGDFFEELSSHVLNFPRLSTNGFESCCPDLQKGRMVIESKATNRVTGRHYLLWEHQIENYEYMTSTEKVQVFYLFWAYRMTGTNPHKVGTYKTRDALRKALAQADIHGWFVPLREMTKVARTRRLEKYCGRKNQNPDEAFYFYRLRPSLLDTATDQYQQVQYPSLVVYESVVANINIRIPNLKETT